jgi:hypothetical protein
MTKPTYGNNVSNPRGTYRDVNEQGSAMPETWQSKPGRIRRAEKWRAQQLAKGKLPRKRADALLPPIA